MGFKQKEGFDLHKTTELLVKTFRFMARETDYDNFLQALLLAEKIIFAEKYKCLIYKMAVNKEAFHLLKVFLVISI